MGVVSGRENGGPGGNKARAWGGWRVEGGSSPLAGGLLAGGAGEGAVTWCELIRPRTPAVLLLGLLKPVADVLRLSSSLVRFPHMA